MVEFAPRKVGSFCTFGVGLARALSGDSGVETVAGKYPTGCLALLRLMSWRARPCACLLRQSSIGEGLAEAQGGALGSPAMAFRDPYRLRTKRGQVTKGSPVSDGGYGHVKAAMDEPRPCA